jgi:HSP90 family molecular chaperone
MKRLFKKVKKLKSGELGKTLEKTDPTELTAFLKELGKSIQFSADEEFTNNPDDVAKFIFGKSVKAADIMTAENVISHVKKLKNSSEILAAAKTELEKVGLPVPPELIS